MELNRSLKKYSAFDDKLYKSYHAYKSMYSRTSGQIGIELQYENWYTSVMELADNKQIVRWVLERRKDTDDYIYGKLIFYADKMRKYLFPIIIVGLVSALNINRFRQLIIASALFGIAIALLLIGEIFVHKNYIILKRFYQDIFTILDELENNKT